MTSHFNALTVYYTFYFYRTQHANQGRCNHQSRWGSKETLNRSKLFILIFLVYDCTTTCLAYYKRGEFLGLDFFHSQKLLLLSGECVLWQGNAQLYSVPDKTFEIVHIKEFADCSVKFGKNNCVSLYRVQNTVKTVKEKCQVTSFFHVRHCRNYLILKEMFLIV